jgi:acyl-coenzyme A thioesterase PaaI-like protein
MSAPESAPAHATASLTVEAINAMIGELFPGTGNVCHEIGNDYAIARHDVRDTEIRPGGFISGPTQFAVADAALWYLVFAATGRIEPMALTSELSMRFLRPAHGEIVWARADLEVAGRRNVVGTVHVWCDDRSTKPTATGQGTYALPH